MQKHNDKIAAVPYAWIIVAVLFVGLVASFGMRASFGAYVTPWELEFSVSRTVVTGVSMLSFIVYALGQPLAGKLNDRFGKSVVPSASIFLIGISLFLTSRADHIWQVFILFGLGFSLGVGGCSQPVTAAIITKWFDKKRGFAIGLTTAGMAAGQLILVPANLFVIEQMGWRTAMAALGIIIIVVVGPLYIIFLRSKPEEKGLKPYGYVESEIDGRQSDGFAPAIKKNLPLLSVFKKKSFYQLTIPYLICGFTDVGLIQTHLIPLTREKGFALGTVALAFSLMAIFNIVGSVVTGHLADHLNRRRQLAAIYSLRALTYILLFAVNRPWLLMLFAVLYGVLEMASIAPLTSLAVQLFDGYSTGALLGVVSISHQIGGAAGSFIPGLLYDITGSYSAVLILSVLMLFAGACLVLRTPEPGRK